MGKDYSKAAGNWAQGIQQAGQKWLNGITSTDVNPAALAVAQKAKLIAHWNDAINSGRWEQALSRVTTASWQQATTQGGSGKYTNGTAKGTPKMAAFFAAAGPIYQQARQLRQSQMDSNARMMANQQLMLQLKGINKRM